MSTGRKSPWALLGLLAAAFGLWLLGAFVVLPQVVRSAYAGTSWGILNRFIKGQAYQSVEGYLNAAERLARLGTVAIAVGLLAAIVGYRFRAVVGRVLTSLIRTEPRRGLSDIVRGAAALGLLFGFLEASLTWTFLRGFSTRFSNPDVLWLTPLVLAALFSVIGVLVFVLTGGWKGGLSQRVIVATCSTLGIWGVLASLRLGVHPFPLLLVSLGTGVQLARLLDRYPRVWVGLTRLAFCVPLFGVVPFIYGTDSRYGGGIAADTPAAAGAPNIVLLVMDTVRGESLGLGGYERDTSPNLDRLAQRGILFTRAIAPSPWTLPTHASMFTGQWPHATGVAWNQGMSEGLPTVAEALQEQGYARGGFVANKDVAGRGTGLERGFDRYVDHPRSFKTWLTSSVVMRRLIRRLTAFGDAPNRKLAPEVNEEFLGWLDELDEGPFFAFLNYFDAHGPYELHRDFLQGFTTENRSLVFDGNGGELPARGSVAREIDSYDSAIRLIDHSIGTLMSELEARGLLANTVFIVTSDHGEHLGDHGLMGHGNSLYSQLILVPLLLAGPPLATGAMSIDSPVSLRDVGATILWLAGGDPSAFAGESLSRFWNGSDPPLQPVLSRVVQRPNAGFSAGPSERGEMWALVEGTLHYISNGDGQEELYDLAVDPRGRRDLAATGLGTQVLPDLRRLLEDSFEAAGAQPRVTSNGPRAGGGN